MSATETRAIGANDTSAGEVLLDVKDLNAFYGRAQILFDVSLHVKRGEVVALIGRNGAGKSTTMKAIIGLVDRVTGSIRFKGRDIVGVEPHVIARSGLGYVPEDRRIFTELTVRENLGVGRQARREGAVEWSIDRVFALFPNLAERADRLASHMSGGEQKMLAVARTLMGNPHLLLLDEPSEGIAPVIAEAMIRMILELKREGTAILLSEQNTRFAELVCDRGYVIESGVASRESRSSAKQRT